MALSISLDCNDLTGQEVFWSEALHYDVVDRATGHVALGPRGGIVGPWLFLNLVPEPKSGKNRMHVDWEVDDIEDEARRLEALGASRSHVGRLAAAGSLPAVEWITMRDPEGNEFCVEQVVR